MNAPLEMLAAHLRAIRAEVNECTDKPEMSQATEIQVLSVSPRFPGEYPDEELCAITINGEPTNYRVRDVYEAYRWTGDRAYLDALKTIDTLLPRVRATKVKQMAAIDELQAIAQAQGEYA